MAFVVVYDACVLYPAPIRDLLMRVAVSNIATARWTDQILDECFDSIQEQRKDLPPEALAKTRQLMCEVVPDCLITGYEHLIPALKLPDADDRHVLAAAIRCGAQAIVTTNLKHFPRENLDPYHIEAKHPDDFVQESIDLSAGALVQIITEQAAALKNPATTVPALLDTLRGLGLVQSVARLRALLDS
jgi:PIN domain-containing protein